MSREIVRAAVGDVSFDMALQTRYWLEGKVFLDGTWEEPEARFALSLVPAGGHAVDVGANVGFYTLALACHVGPRGRVLAVEPASEACTRLEDNIRRNGLTNVRLARAAAAESPGSLTLHLSATDLGSSSCVRVPSPYEAAGTETVTAAPLDDLIQEAGIEPHFIKIDAEGMELAVLRGAARTLRARRPALMVELNPIALRATGNSVADLVSALRDLGYVVGALNGTPVERIDLPDGTWLNAFALPAQA